MKRKLATLDEGFLAESFYTNHMVGGMAHLLSNSADHLQGLTKCSSPRDHKYKAIVGTLERWLDEINLATLNGSNDVAVNIAARSQEDGPSKDTAPPEQQEQVNSAAPETSNAPGGKSFGDFQASGQSELHAGDAYYGNFYYNYATNIGDGRPEE